MINELLKLSRIFKHGFTIELKEGKINQYTNYDKPFIVSYKTIVTIDYNNLQYKAKLTPQPTLKIEGKIPLNCIIGGWHDTDINIYYIELNLAFDTKEHAITVAETLNQKAIYDIRTGNVIEV